MHASLQKALDFAAHSLHLPARPRIPTPLLVQPQRRSLQQLHPAVTPAFRSPHTFHTAPLPIGVVSPALPTTWDAPFAHATAPTTWPPTLPLRWDWRDAVYTDGACVTGAHGNVLGAAFYHGPTDALFTVDPCGLGATNTIMRAELGAIQQALAQSLPAREHLHLWTDSQVSIYMLSTCALLS